MNSQKLRLALSGAALSAFLALHACSGGDTGGPAGGEGGAGDDGTTGSASSGGSSSGGISGSSGSGGSGGGASSSGGAASSGAGSASSSGIVYTCTGCIDLSGHCNPGNADTRCGLNSSTCQDCTTNRPPQVCGPSGDCVNPGTTSSSSSGSGGSDAGGG